MQIQQIRNGTNKIVYGDTTFLLDPYLGEKGALGTLGDIYGTELGEITLVKTATCHGKIIPFRDTRGVVLLKEGEKALYVAGDTIWYEGVRQVLQDFKPRVVMVNGCAATLLGCGRLSMDDEDIESVSRNLPDAVVYVTHMDNDAAACITRHEMRGRLTNRGVTSYIMPRDGQTIHF